MKFLDFLSTHVETPKPFGLFHLISLAIIVAVTIVLVVKAKKISDKQFRTIIAVFWGLIVTTEILKQICMNYTGDPNNLFDYSWYMFPFQFCSMPLYLLPFVAFGKDSKMRDGIMLFLASFSLFAGFVVAFVYPGDVFCYYGFINAQTLIHHGTQFITGVFIAVYYKEKLNIKNLLRGNVVFLVVSALAIVLDVVMYHVIPSGETFNMFFISPYFESTLAVVGQFYNKVPYPVFLLIYIGGFAVVSVVTYLLVSTPIKLLNRKKVSQEEEKKVA